MLSLLLVSCVMDDSYRKGIDNCVSITNYSEKAIYWQLRKAPDPESSAFNKLPFKGYTLVETEPDVSYVLYFTSVASKATVIEGGVLVTKENMEEIESIPIPSSNAKTNIYFKADSDGKIVYSMDGD